MTEDRSNLPRSKQNVLAVRVTDEEYAIIRAGAASDSRAVADYVRVHMLARAIMDARGSASASFDSIS